jgi:hypothetical protein
MWVCCAAIVMCEVLPIHSLCFSLTQSLFSISEVKSRAARGPTGAALRETNELYCCRCQTLCVCVCVCECLFWGGGIDHGGIQAHPPGPGGKAHAQQPLNRTAATLWQGQATQVHSDCTSDSRACP